MYGYLEHPQTDNSASAFANMGCNNIQLDYQYSFKRFWNSKKSQSVMFELKHTETSKPTIVLASVLR
ncbi:uncharacterized protein CANTADRAFT_89898 [Suhomyces tanzawaensis NRRL Y-17324]|uniref:Uncharacterized protein n=1 Tax=Suhomyces tanzawaensis NRRL Y-17324 TaxID=984487 RepID=A0A1E4SLF5_9ASCO|nr:uncharacterized protein CANTADRAFT_89898 [Suhomyces tanzawaensis NRRL Y-17324]ODV80343.1 hypothetical protein CANTADRAFT_89898 [Suhomyces tanzawaensis NRRL Y-17324]